MTSRRRRRLEWLETNHTGAFAMGTVAGVNTRRYHGLLIATLHPPSDRYSVLPRMEEIVEIGEPGLSWQLFSIRDSFARRISILESFSYLPYPTWRYQCDSAHGSRSRSG